MVNRRRPFDAKIVREENEENKYPHYSHAETITEWNGVKIHIHEDGKVTLTQVNNVDGEEVEDTINTSASLIYRLASMLSTTKRTQWKDTPYKKEVSNDGNENR